MNEIKKSQEITAVGAIVPAKPVKPVKTIKVRLHHVDTGYCIEIWETPRIDGRRYYFGRDTYGDHRWSYVVDAPYGYCEKDRPVGGHVVFIVCDRRWRELSRSGNGLAVAGNNGVDPGKTDDRA